MGAINSFVRRLGFRPAVAPPASLYEPETLAHLQLANALGYTGVDAPFVDQVVKVLKRHNAWDEQWEYLYDPNFGVFEDPDYPGRIKGMLSLRGRPVEAVPDQPGLLYTPATATDYAQVNISGGLLQITGIPWPDMPRFTMVGVDRTLSQQETWLWGFSTGDVSIHSALQYGYRRWSYSTNYRGNTLTFNDGTNYRGQWLGTVAWFDFDQPVQLQAHSRDGLLGLDLPWNEAQPIGYLAYQPFTFYVGSILPAGFPGGALLRLQGLRPGLDRALMEDLRELGYAERSRRNPVVADGAVIHFRDEEVDFYDYDLASELSIGPRWGYNPTYQGSYTTNSGQVAVPRAVVRSQGVTRIELEFLKSPDYEFTPESTPTRVYLNGELEAELMSYGPAGWVSWKSRVLPPSDYRVRLVTGHLTVLKQLRVVAAIDELSTWTGPVAPTFVEENDFTYGINPMVNADTNPRHHGGAARTQGAGSRYDATGYASDAVRVWSAVDAHPAISQQMWVELNHGLVGAFSLRTYPNNLDSAPCFTYRVPPAVHNVAVSNLSADYCWADAIEFSDQPVALVPDALNRLDPRLRYHPAGNWTDSSGRHATNRYRDWVEVTYERYGRYTYGAANADQEPYPPLLQLYRDGCPVGGPVHPTPGQVLFDDTPAPGCRHTLRVELLSPSDYTFLCINNGDFALC